MDDYLLQLPLHRSFHRALNAILDHLARQYGAAELASMFEAIARRVYAPLIAAVGTGGLAVLARHYTAVIRREDGDVAVRQSAGCLALDVLCDPAVRTIIDHGDRLSPHYHPVAINAVNRAIAQAAGLAYRVQFSEDPARYTHRWEQPS